MFSLRAFLSSPDWYAFDRHFRSIGSRGLAPANMGGYARNEISATPLIIDIATPHSRGVGLPPIGKSDQSVDAGIG
jgi:hypothetical protein